MKRFLMIVLLSVLVVGVSGCSCGGLSNGGFGSRLGNLGSGFGNSQGILPSLQDGPVRRWLRGDSCDTCNVPSGQITYDSGLDSSCQSGLCNAPVGEPVYGVPTAIGAPVTSGYAPVQGEIPIQSASPDLSMGYSSDPYGSADVYGGTSDGMVIPPLGN